MKWSGTTFVKQRLVLTLRREVLRLDVEDAHTVDNLVYNDGEGVHVRPLRAFFRRVRVSQQLRGPP